MANFFIESDEEKLWRNEKEDVPWTNDTSSFRKLYFSFFAARASRTFASISSANSGLSFNKSFAAVECMFAYRCLFPYLQHICSTFTQMARLITVCISRRLSNLSCRWGASHRCSSLKRELLSSYIIKAHNWKGNDSVVCFFCIIAFVISTWRKTMKKRKRGWVMD